MKIANHLEALQPSYLREILHAATQPNMISLSGGLPSEQSFPLHLMGEAIDNLGHTPSLFQYGLSEGYEPLLAHCKKRYQMADNQQALVCNGTQQALDLIARTYLNPGDGVAIESPSYLGALQVFSIAQANVQAVSQNNQGPDLDILEALFAKGKTKMFYSVPDFHNPTGVCWSLATRQQVARLCEQFNVTLIEDSPYRSIRFSGEPLPMVSSFCPDHSIVLRSFSKVVSPGIRLGLVITRSDWLKPIIRIKQAADLHTNLPMQSVLLTTLEHPEFDQHITKICKQYGDSYQALSDVIDQHISDFCTYEPVNGGMFVWLKLAEQTNAMAIAERALENQVAVVPGDVFYPNNHVLGMRLRLNFSHTPKTQFDQAVSRLAQCFY